MGKMFRKIAFALCLATLPACSAGPRGGMPDYCYVVGRSPWAIPHQYFHLMGHRKWSVDIHMGVFESPDAAAGAAKQLDCPFRY